MPAPKVIKELIGRFDRNLDAYRSGHGKTALQRQIDATAAARSTFWTGMLSRRTLRERQLLKRQNRDFQDKKMNRIKKKGVYRSDQPSCKSRNPANPDSDSKGTHA